MCNDIVSCVSPINENMKYRLFIMHDKMSVGDLYSGFKWHLKRFNNGIKYKAVKTVMGISLKEM